MNWRVSVDKWLSVSVRRYELDKDLVGLQDYIRGQVPEIGAGKAG